MARRSLVVVGGIAFATFVACACGLSLTGTGDVLDVGRAEAGAQGADGSIVGLEGDGASATDAPEASSSTDAGLDAPDAISIACVAAVCVDAGGACSGATGACRFDCQGGSCGRVVCPPGMPCEVSCAKDSCDSGIDCTQASSCDIQCFGGNACNGDAITCSGSSCSVSCIDGGNECQLPISCDASTCSIRCGSAANVCTSPVTCIASTCSVLCTAKAACNPLLIIAADAAVDCTQDKDSCLDVSCYADGGKCVVQCDAAACGNEVCCSGTCAGNAGGAAPACGPL